MNAPEGTEWLCFCCNSKPLSRLVKANNRIMNILETRKAQKTLFKTKKGPSLVEIPSQKERRNRLSSLTENIGASSDGALSPAESPSKKTLPDVVESDSNLEDDDSDQNNEKKSKERTSYIYHTKHPGEGESSGGEGVVGWYSEYMVEIRLGYGRE